MSKRAGERLTGAKVVSHLGVMVAVSIVMGVVAAGLAIPFAGAIGMGSREVADSIDELPADLTPEELQQKTQVLDSKGTVIAELYKENRINVSLDQVSPIMVKAIVAIEDYRYYQHGAIDLKGTLRAFLTNQASSGTVQGGSSITQQMVKLTLLDQAKTKDERAAAIDDTYARKIRELRYAIAFEKNYSKDWILKRYLNIAYFGDGAYGIQAAAKHYFSVDAADLNLRQSAMLAGLVKNPTGYDPTNSPDRAVERRNVVLDRMSQLSVIDDAKAEKAKEKPIGLDPTKNSTGCVTSRAPFFCDYVVRYLMEDPKLGATRRDRKSALFGGGLTIHTTIDLRYQDAADTSVRDHVYPTDQAIGGLAMVEPGTGEVRAISQSRPMGAKAKQGQTYLNYVVPRKYGDANGFQGGSTFKVFVLAAAINKGIPLSKSIPSPSTVSLPVSDFKTCGNQYLGGSEVWSPSNSTGSSPAYNLYTGTQQSINTFYAQLEVETGLCEPFQLAKEMGITLDDPDTQRVPAFVLGISDTNPLEMAEAYATFAARGKHCSSRPVTSIEDSDGKTIREYPAQCRQVLPQSTADAVNDILAGVTGPGGFASAIATAQPSAGKTGTINDNKAVWFAGYTPNLATAAVVGGANQQGTQLTLSNTTIGGQYVGSAFGSTLAGPIWGDAMKSVEQWLPDTDFTEPDGSEIQGVNTVVPSVSCLSVEDAKGSLAASNLTGVEGSGVNSECPVGSVAYTDPSTGSIAYSGQTVTMYISTGPKPKGKPGKGPGKGPGKPGRN